LLSGSISCAAAAKAGIYGNDAVEAMYPLTTVLPNGDVIDTSKHNYTLTFAKGEFPPVNAFWSVTMYDGKTRFLIENPINRYLINSPMLPGLRTNPDGSVTIYIQNKTPGKAKESNWLPAPDGPDYIVMRLYWPKETPPQSSRPGKVLGNLPRWSSHRISGRTPGAANRSVISHERRFLVPQSRRSLLALRGQLATFRRRG
jgi:hypothetical protein